MTEELPLIDVGPRNPHGLPWFATYDQWQSMGRTVKKGEKAWSFEYGPDFRRRTPLFRASQTQEIERPYYEDGDL